VSGRRGVVLALVGLALATSGCGVTHDKAARAIDLPFRVTDSTTTSTTAAPPPTTAATTSTTPRPTTTATTVPTDLVALYFVVGDRIRLTYRNVVLASNGARLDPLGIVRELERPPPGVDTLVHTEVANVVVDRGRAIVALNPSFFVLSPPPQLVIVAQLVLTLTDRPGIGRVGFVDQDGQPVGVPRADGSPGDDVVAEDYVALRVA
jgi:hypothetical protein